MEHSSAFERTFRGIALGAVVLFFMFPIFWILLMSFQTNETILRSPPSMMFKPTIQNYVALITGRLETQAGTLDINFMQNLMNSVILSVCSVALSLLLGVPAAYAFARHKFRGSEDIAFTLLSFRFAPPLLVLLPLTLYFQQIGLADTYLGLIWVYQLICLPLILWIVPGLFRGHQPRRRTCLPDRRPRMGRDLPEDRAAARRSGHRGGGASCLHLRLEQLHLRAGPGLGRQAAGDGRRAGLRHRLRHPVWPDRRRRGAFHRPHAGACSLCTTLSRRGPVARRRERMIPWVD